jgi:hypothetical protein
LRQSAAVHGQIKIDMQIQLIKTYTKPLTALMGNRCLEDVQFPHHVLSYTKNVFKIHKMICTSLQQL